MTKQFKIFLILLIVCLLSLGGIYLYRWISRPSLEITIVFKSGVSDEFAKEIILGKDAKIKFIKPSEGGVAYDVRLPWYLGLPGCKDIKDIIRELNSVPEVKRIVKPGSLMWD